MTAPPAAHAAPPAPVDRLPPAGQPAGRRARPPRWAEWGLLAASLVAAAGLCRMASGGLGSGALPPLLGLALVGFVVPAVLLRTRLPPPLVAVVGTVLLVLVAIWVAVLQAGISWFPTGAALRTLADDLRRARAELASFHPPLHAGPGLVLIGALVAGLAGLAGRLLLEPSRSRRPRPHPAAALVPALALVGWSCIALPGTGAAVLVAAFVATATIVLAAAATGRNAATVPAGRLRPGASGAAALVGLLAVAGAVGLGIPLGTAGAGTGTGTSPIPPTTLSLATSLVRVERDDANVLLFTARSPVATYWQVGVLTVWRDDRWVPGPGTTSVIHGGTAPAAPPAPAPAGGRSRPFTASVTIADLSSRLLPVPPSTVSVSAAGAALTTAGVVAPSVSKPGQTYTATALDTAVTDAGGSGSTTDAGGLSAAELELYLALPPVPAEVGTLARQVTASAASPLTQAEELVNWFQSGAFRYTLTAPAAPAGTNPLVAFLTVSRAGSCEAFAGAFAVMARALGLPTRVAVGFTEGHTADGIATIRGADAHAWPEVYLGATRGWVSFEPTPERPSGEIAPSNVIGPTAITVPSPSPTTPPTTQTSPTTTTTLAPTPTTTVTTQPASTVPTRHSTRQTATDALGVLVVVLVVLAVAAVGAWLVVRRRRRQTGRPPGERVVAAYRRTERALRRSGIGRPPSRTPVAHSRALLVAADRFPPTVAPGGDELLAALRDLGQLALLVEQAGYSPHPLLPAEADVAEAAARRVCRTLRRPAVRSLARTLPTRLSVPRLLSDRGRA